MKHQTLQLQHNLLLIVGFCLVILSLNGSSSTATSAEIKITEQTEATLGSEIINLLEDLVSEGISHRVRSRLLDNLKTALIEHRQFALDTELSELAEDILEESLSQRVRIRLVNTFIEKLCNKMHVTEPTYNTTPQQPATSNDCFHAIAPARHSSAQPSYRTPLQSRQELLQRSSYISRGNQILQIPARSALADSAPQQPLPPHDYFQVVEQTHYQAAPSPQQPAARNTLPAPSRLPLMPPTMNTGPSTSRGNQILQIPARSALADSAPQQPLPPHDYFQVVEQTHYQAAPSPQQSATRNTLPVPSRLPLMPSTLNTGPSTSRGNQTLQDPPQLIEPTYYQAAQPPQQPATRTTLPAVPSRLPLLSSTLNTRMSNLSSYNTDNMANQTSSPNLGVEDFSRSWNGYIQRLDQINKKLSQYRASSAVKYSKWSIEINSLERYISKKIRTLNEICEDFESAIILRNSEKSLLWGDPVIAQIADKSARLIDPEIIASSWVSLLIKKRTSLAEIYNKKDWSFNYLVEWQLPVEQHDDLMKNNSHTFDALFDLYRQKLAILIQITDFLKTYAMQKAFDSGYIAVATKVSEKYHEMQSDT